MSDYAVGRGKPPKHSQFKKGTSGNPRGRPKHDGNELGKIINAVANVTVEYLEGGRLRRVTRHELNLKSLISQALAGDVRAAEMLLTFREEHQHGTGGVERIEIRNWPPDYPGQTGEQKTAEHVKQARIPQTGRVGRGDGDPIS
jgi:uncharacterized protein DUF5681